MIVTLTSNRIIFTMKATNVLLTAVSSMIMTQSAYCFSLANQSSTRLLPAQATASFLQPGWDADSLEQYAGSYEIRPNGQLTVSSADGKLFILPPGETDKAELKWIKGAEYEVVGQQARVIFRKDEQGHVKGLEVHFGNGNSASARKR